MGDGTPDNPSTENAGELEEKPVDRETANPSPGNIQSSAENSGAASADPDWSPSTLEFMKVWATSWQEVLSQIAGGAVHCDLSGTTPAGMSPADADLLVVAAVEGGLRGELSLRMAQSSALRLACLLLGETEAEGAEFNSERREALEELLRQVSGKIATALKGHWGEVHLRWDTSGPVAWTAAAAGWLLLRSDAGWSASVQWQLSAALHAALASAAKPADDRPPAPETPASPPLEASSPLLPAEQLDLILDVELALTLRFGAKILLLQEILQLNAGAVVELDRQVEEPVELLLEGRPIARGEVVVVDGNYGLRVHEVFSPSSTT